MNPEQNNLDQATNTQPDPAPVNPNVVVPDASPLSVSQPQLQQPAPVATYVPQIVGADLQPASPTKKRRGLGLAIFLVLTLIFLSPLLPGKIADSLGGTSGSVISGEGITCEGESSDTKVLNRYSDKKGFPLTYGYSSSSIIQQICNGEQQTSQPSGESSAFSPLAIGIDILAALVLALIIAKLLPKRA